MSLAPTLRCPCDGAHRQETFAYAAAPEGETRFDIPPADYRRAYDRCELCGHWFGRHGIDLSSLYDDAYVDATYGGSAGMAEKLHKILALPPERSDNAGRVARIAAFAADHFGTAPAARRLLDVGAGLGVFPAAMKAAGWQVTGIEPDPRTADHLRREVGIEALSDDLVTLDPAVIGRFDLISFNKVLEHIEDPVALLAHAHTMMAAGGFCYVELPDVAAAAEGPGREEFFIEHHHVFSPASLTLLVERAGFALLCLERLREPSGKFTLRAFLSPDVSDAAP